MSKSPATASFERKPVRRALISVSDKTDLASLGQALVAAGVQIVATSSTVAALDEAGVAAVRVEDVTGFPELLGGRVKTLHPAIHAGLLVKQDDPVGLAELEGLDLAPFDLVVVNLYPFAATLRGCGSHENLIEMIDIGGPTMIRAAAKNYSSVACITSPTQYPDLIDALRNGGTTAEQRRTWATSAFQQVADYDVEIANWLTAGEDPTAVTRPWFGTTYQLRKSLRYGENPHQLAALYTSGSEPQGIASAQVLGGKALSYNNLQDADAALRAVNTVDYAPGVAIIKHANPCGIAVADNLTDAYRKALASDPISAFGGVVALNRSVDADTAEQIIQVFTEVVIAPGFTEDALKILRSRANLRILECATGTAGHQLRPLSGGLLIQTSDSTGAEDEFASWDLVAGEAVSEQTARDLQFAWYACLPVKSNAIVLVKNQATVGIGMGQVSRVDAAQHAVTRAGAGAGARGAVAASDAFFPFPDGLQILADAGVRAVVAPGGSKNDHLVIEAARKAALSLYFTARRHFTH
ncbi:bifunctional phosphoribosylaminoimidazolecarboxamide formyltransferase/IMP cyclohydrolase [Actinomyces minihominis]|uniref:bifunctional phosphoribosylaminoimidazolecarboxamide formyltransferase/IMP cyclohydrolase n=1 Tax=Actinomyces minihominis TaxID=2002838 RepID=UPI000C078BE3|nr:bifunctional phosphoribosylaminoimidazolecarboxamide formyltransferase/IMP cyclohydrolase [Actinomyces minihominis]